MIWIIATVFFGVLSLLLAVGLIETIEVSKRYRGRADDAQASLILLRGQMKALRAQHEYLKNLVKILGELP